jgi:hypothetical protein
MIIRKACPTVFTNLDDGTAVLLNLTTLLYYNLNRTAAVIWREIEHKKSVDLAELVQLLSARYDVEDRVASNHLVSFLGKLAEYGVVETGVESGGRA